MRVALYWAPAPDDPLAKAGNAWLGRDAERGVDVAQPPIASLAAITAAPRRYGFHATLRPPMRLATGWEEFIGAVQTVAAAIAPFDMPPLDVAEMSGFLALREASPCPALHALADACLAGTDKHRLRPGAADIARRRAAGLSARQDAMLLRWGYPHVLQDWRFHLTLSGRLDRATLTRLRPAAEMHFAPSLALCRRVETIAIFTQAEGEAFLIAEWIGLGG